MSASDALAHVEAALGELVIRGTQIDARSGAETPIDELRLTVADELERIDRALGAVGGTILFAMAANVRQAVIELAAARAALKGERS